jgi:quinol monooxygenase YgiN
LWSSAERFRRFPALAVLLTLREHCWHRRFEAWDNAAALDAYRATDRFKKYQVTTANMVSKRDIRVFSSVAMNFKATH